MHYNGVPNMPVPGPIAREIVSSLTSGEHPVPIVPVVPVGTFPAKAPPGSPEPSPQPTYQVANPNSWMGMSPQYAKLVQFGFAGIAAVGIVWLGRNLIDSSNSDRKVIVDSFQQTQKDSREDGRERDKMLGSSLKDVTVALVEISANLARVSRSQERLELKLEGKKE